MGEIERMQLQVLNELGSIGMMLTNWLIDVNVDVEECHCYIL